MTKLAVPFAAAAIIAAGAAILPAPAAAQSKDKISEIIVYGADPCPRSTDDQVVVCARKPEGDRYRIPERYRSAGPRQTRESWAARAKSFETVGATGINSCSAVGPGGFTGCLAQIIDKARQETREGAEDYVPPKE